MNPALTILKLAETAVQVDKIRPDEPLCIHPNHRFEVPISFMQRVGIGRPSLPLNESFASHDYLLQTGDDDRHAPFESDPCDAAPLLARLRRPYLFRVRDGRGEALAPQECIIHRQQGM